jgi:outer membrane murein-binding lipoprotein Lpp
MFGFTIIKTRELDELRQTIRALDAYGERLKQDRDLARAELAPLKAARERANANLRRKAG